jgi:hypothetical protein
MGTSCDIVVVIYDFEGIMAVPGDNMIPVRLEWLASLEEHSRVDDSIDKRYPDKADQYNLSGFADANPDE